METLRKKFYSLYTKSQPNTDELEEPKVQQVVQMMQEREEKQMQDEEKLLNKPLASSGSGSGGAGGSGGDNDGTEEKTKQETKTTPDVQTQTPPPLTNDEDGSTMSSTPVLTKIQKELPMKINYEAEFMHFINHNTPPGFNKKLEGMLPYLTASFISWPTYWIWRGLYWQQKRNTERIGMYIQRTFQHAKIMQVAILATGLFMATSGRSSTGLYSVHDVNNQGVPNRSKMDD